MHLRVRRRIAAGIVLLLRLGTQLFADITLPGQPPPQSGRGWLLIFGIALVAFLVLRGRANRSFA